IAQSEAANEKQFVRYWMHFGFLNINKEKMSKSLGNFFTAREILKKYPAEAIRLLFVQSHYRSPLNFSDELLSAAQKGYEKILNFAETIEDGINRNISDGNQPVFDIKKYETEFSDSMDDDFNTPQATAVIFDFIRDANKVIAENENINSQFFLEVKKFLMKTAEDVLGIIDYGELNKSKIDTSEDDFIKEQIRLRQKAKKEKNYQLADQIRNQLAERGIILQDGKSGTTYKRN
ncbi:MAG: class I tRNA ligase family protein, partial [Melioribacteraceae bacterium]|nr:class I tRNA ligase family protein [Melioribacteraceae bacterium]